MTDFDPIDDAELDEVRRFIDAGNGDVLPTETLSRLLQRIDSDRWHLENAWPRTPKIGRAAALKELEGWRLGETMVNIYDCLYWAADELRRRTPRDAWLAGEDVTDRISTGAIVKCAHCMKPLSECLGTNDCWLVR